MTVDWSAYRACPHCFAELGKPCLLLSGSRGGTAVAVEAERPHGGRKLRAVNSRG